MAGAGADPTALEIQLLSSTEYYQDAGNNTLGFVTRLYDDVLRHDPTEIEVATALTVLNTGGDTARNQLVQDVVLSPEARAITRTSRLARVPRGVTKSERARAPIPWRK